VREPGSHLCRARPWANLGFPHPSRWLVLSSVAAAADRLDKLAVMRLAHDDLPTGVRGLDDILGGGIPEFSFNVIAGTPGCGKTTLAHQIVFANATAKKGPRSISPSSANPP
jgi:predicted ATP-dependent serine protease